MERGLLRFAASIVCASLLAACGGGGTGSAVPVQGTQSQTANVAIALTFPSKATAAKLNGRHPNYIPSGTQGIGIDFAANPSGYTNAPANAHPNVGSALVAGTAPCGPADGTGKYSCVVYLPAVPVGYIDFKVSLWNGQPTGCDAKGNNCDFTAASALSTTVITDLAIKQGQQNNFNLGFAAQVDSVYVALSGGIVDGTASSLTATVTLKDSSGFTIVNAPSLYDKNGAALTVSLNLPATGGGSLSFPGPSSSVSFSSVGSTSNSVNLNYNGAYQFASSGGSQPSVAASLNGGAINGSIVNSPLSVTQSNNSVSVPGVPQMAQVGATFGAAPGDVALGSDGNLWVAEGTNLLQMTTAGATTTYATGHLINTVHNIGDGYIWYFDTGPAGTTAQYGRFSPTNFAGTNVETTTTAIPQRLGRLPFNVYMAMGNDGYVYAPDDQNDAIDKMAPNSFPATVTAITPPWPNNGSDNGAIGITAGPAVNGGNPSICAASNQKYVACYDTIAHTWGTYATATLPVDGALVYGPDGYLYAGEGDRYKLPQTSGAIGQFTVDASGNVSLVHTFTLASNSPVQGMVVGHDGNLWFSTFTSVGKLDTSSTAAIGSRLTEYTSNLGVSLVYPTNNLFDLVAGPAPNYLLYTIDAGANKLYSITP